MAKQKIEIEVDVPDGFEFVRLSQHSNTATGEHTNGAVVVHNVSYFVIVRKSWQWPDWLTAEWIARDADGEWWAFNKKPHAACGSWISEHGRYFYMAESLVNFTPPPCTDWTQSLRRNPKAEVAK